MGQTEVSLISGVDVNVAELRDGSDIRLLHAVSSGIQLEAVQQPRKPSFFKAASKGSSGLLLSVPGGRKKTLSITFF